MINRINGKTIAVVFSLSLIIILSGCSSKEQQYELLSFFFTGIPSYEEFVEGKKETKEEKDEEYEVKTYYAHPSWAENKCSDCHQSEESDDEIANESNLIDIPEKLCIKCHVSKSIRHAIKNRLTLHSPVAQGKCLSCHAAHKSDYPFHLIETMNNNLCTGCHDLDNLSKTTHKDKKYLSTDAVKKYGCLACHTPHISENKNLLNSEFLSAN